MLCNEEYGAWGMFSISVFDGMGKQYLPWNKDCHSSHEDALVTTYYDDNLVLEMEQAIQKWKGTQ